MPKDHPPPAKSENESAFQRFQRLAQKIISVPKVQIDKSKGPPGKPPRQK